MISIISDRRDGGIGQAHARVSALGALAALAVLPFRPVSGQEARLPEHPGQRLQTPAAISKSTAGSRCLELTWNEPRATLSDRLLSETCRVIDSNGVDVPTLRSRWSWARYRRVLVYGPDSRTTPADSSLFPDTLPEDELVVFAAHPGSDSVIPVWHDRADARLELIDEPGFARLSEGSVIFVHRRCLNGTGGCFDFPYQLRSDGAVAPLQMRYVADLQEALPKEWGTWKGIRLEVDPPSMRAPVYVPGDPNCCSSFSAAAGLSMRAGRLMADSIRVAAESHGMAWEVEPERRFGHVRPRFSFDDLVDSYGASQVNVAEVYLAEGFCTLGAVVFPGVPQEIEIAWADSARTRVAFVRTEEKGSPWHTPSGVRVGSSLDSLERIAGEPLTFSGFGWDYGGGLDWKRDGGSLTLRIAPVPYEQVRQLPVDDPRTEELFGEVTVRSNHPLVQRLNIEVQEMALNWARPATERECESFGQRP